MRDAVLEREYEMRTLEEALEDAIAGAGSAVLVFGEAGIGKSSLVRAFLASAGSEARVLFGACDDLLTPRTLGPFRDMGRASKGKLATAVSQGSDRDAVFGAVLDELAVPTTIMVIEDVHWADDATLDVIRYLSRRIGSVPGMVILTYRHDELRDDHPLLRVLGGFAGEGARRLHLRPLSLDAVRDMSLGSSVNAVEVFDATQGNAFFVAEALAAPDSIVPATVRDAVLARVRSLAPATREALAVLSVIPVRIDRWLVEALLEDPGSVLEEAEQRGVLVSDTNQVWFRHEIARRAVQQALAPSARLDHNRRVLQRLVAHPDPDLAQVVHHAREADDPERVVRYALQAAAEAARAGAYREALSHFEQVL
ncbi:MAG: AAA family ATPase, partial [Actinomycetota bacterium]|nr:AAA family ATPase [Actinomycetota bacterium]